MISFRNLTIRRKLQFLVVFAIASLTVTLAIADVLLHRFGVNGPLYKYVVDRKELLTELLPPSIYVSESYMILQEMETETDKAAIESGRVKFRDGIRLHDERRDYYLKNVIVDDQLKKLLERDMHEPLVRFSAIALQEYFPLLGGTPQERTAASKILREKLAPLFKEHAKAVLAAGERLRELTNTAEQKAAATGEFWQIFLLVLTAVSIISMFLVGWSTISGIHESTDVLLKRVNEMAGGASDLTARIEVKGGDEMGQLASGINAMIAKIQTVVAKVREASVQLLSTASEINATARQQESTMQHLGSSTTQIAAAVREISATSNDLVGTMSEVSDKANHTSALALSGRSRLAGMEMTMQQLVESTSAISSKLTTIREKADNINLVVTTITKVADQTNLLSINAAIEAEKAGEYGRGFLVVAREIRRLADQTAVATLDIENMVRHMHDAVSAGVMQMDQFSDEVKTGVNRVAEINGQTGQIIEEVRGLNDRFRLVNEGMKNQSIGAQQINDAMVSVSSGTKETSASLQEFQKATAHLRSAVENLNHEIARFTV
ncbi:methyl-accepting chemotaxis protein [Zavarzinella formosa]|uniref:methyl-accepting chemotaxis protein n=1 Tax=Zavarzinella formosa TaxID=360055 RepID=UPI0002DB4D9E|nr:methyl-accepting chemotaxis protein [Zavarzinella formosa]